MIGKWMGLKRPKLEVEQILLTIVVMKIGKLMIIRDEDICSF